MDFLHFKMYSMFGCTAACLALLCFQIRAIVNDRREERKQKKKGAAPGLKFPVCYEITRKAKNGDVFVTVNGETKILEDCGPDLFFARPTYNSNTREVLVCGFDILEHNKNFDWRMV